MSEPILDVRLDQVDHEIKILMNSPGTELPTVIVAERGADGPKGDKGDKGDPGEFGSSFNFEQSTPATEWIVNHNFGRKPNADVLSVGGQKVGARIVHTSVNQLRVYFNTPQTGEVVCV